MHIALIAMSGVRAASEELNRVGMTMPGFVERSKVIASLPSLSLLTLAGMTPDRFEVSYHEIADLRLVDELPECDVAAREPCFATGNPAPAMTNAVAVETLKVFAALDPVPAVSMKRSCRERS